jgi:hypothetical protein
MKFAIFFIICSIIGAFFSNIGGQQYTTSSDVVSSTLQKVAKDMKRKVDVNSDGLINCIDAAVLFYKYYPDKSNVTISVNENSATNFHHLFNVVLEPNGVWRGIEPQAVYSRQKSVYMKDVWGSKYDSSLNKVVTKDYLKYVK